ncbi:MAG TPA: alpha-ketoglutarate-dependent dioxygenase AlkB [Ilumatobacter sp.]|nr:alpha-ketoglutarate-dependent dioxygenase AlkB [Ilumatobacter sp.]
MNDQLSMFDPCDSTVTHLALDGADVAYQPSFFSPDDADRLFTSVEASTNWRREMIRMYGREVPVPRLTAWVGDPGKSYTYSNIALQPEPWSEPLLEMRALVEREAGVTFNSVLLNLYRTGADGVAWHSDDEPELGQAPVIASVSLGATRRFQLRRRDDHAVRHELDLRHGSLLMMRGDTQHVWEHQVPKTAKPTAPRINLTFRTIQ